MTAPDTPPPHVESPPPTQDVARDGAAGRLLAWLALGAAGAAVAASVVLWQRLNQAEEGLARRSADTLTEAAAARTLAAQADAQTKELQARLGVAEIRLSEMSLQRSQLEELMLSVSRSRDDSLVQDLESTLRLAVQQSQLTGSAQPLISALQGAEQRIERAAQPRLNPVQRAIARDIERLRAASAVDTPALVARFDELVRQLDTLVTRNAMPEAVSVTGTHVDASTAAVAEPPSEPVAETSGWAQAWSDFNQWRQAATARWWAQFRAGTADLVRISRIDQPEAALLAPEQSYFLRENIKLLLLNARLGLLARQYDTARSDVAAAHRLVERYFDPQHANTRLALQTLEQLQTDLRQEALPRPDDTLAALAVAASGR